MTTISEQTHTLTGKYIDGCISEEELRELETVMAEHDEARVAFLNEVHLHARLGMIAGGVGDEQPEKRSVIPVLPKRRLVFSRLAIPLRLRRAWRSLRHWSSVSGGKG
jgi:hypothetical protein